MSDEQVWLNASNCCAELKKKKEKKKSLNRFTVNVTVQVPDDAALTQSWTLQLHC